MPNSYIICATPRSGTTLLTDLLTDTGVAGRPDSFFRQPSLRWWSDYLGVSHVDWPDNGYFNRDYLAAVIVEGTAGTGIFGMRLMWESLDNLSRQLDRLFPGLANDHARFTAAFGHLTYIRLLRQNSVAQAVSRLKAEQSGVWHRHPDGRERERLSKEQPYRYDADRLSELVAEIEDQNQAWEDWFEREKVEPVRITYEELHEDYRTTVATLLSALGQDPASAQHLDPRTARLSDELSLEWVRRFNQ